MPPDQLTAWMADAPNAPWRLGTRPVPPLGAHDVELRVSACALCHSDLHLWRGEWSASFPLVAGHEIVGRIVRVGDDVSAWTVGDRVGVGWQAGACLQCAECQAGSPQLCTHGKVRTCVHRDGGLAERVVVDARFVYLIPQSLADAEAAPLLCAGVTVFSPLRRFGISDGARVGVVGLGGLGHLAVQFARAMGARVEVCDPDLTKAADARAFGADAIYAPEDEAARRSRSGSYDLLLVTTPAELDWDAWMSTLRIGGTLCLLGVPSRPIHLSADHLLDGQRVLTGSVIGSPSMMREMLAFAAAHAVRPRIERFPIAEVPSAFARLASGEARFRVVLER